MIIGLAKPSFAGRIEARWQVGSPLGAIGLRSTVPHRAARLLPALSMPHSEIFAFLAFYFRRLYKLFQGSLW